MEPEQAKPSSISTSALSVLGALASGIGVVAFIVFVGGVVELARARGAGLSGPYVASRVPRTQLLASGADQLFNPFVFALLAVLIAAGFGQVGRKWPGHGWVWVRRLLLLAAAAVGIILFRHQVGDPNPFFQRGDREVAFAAAILVLIGGGVAIDRLAPPPAKQTQLSTPRWIGYLSVVAATTLAFGSLLVFARNEWRPQVRPVALIGPEYPKGLTGVYAGEDNNHIYVGIIGRPIPGIANTRAGTRVIVVNRSKITGLSVAGLVELHRDRKAHPVVTPLQPIENALLAELKRDASSAP